jgi:uncharacterized RDD family membrane protein YckC
MMTTFATRSALVTALLALSLAATAWLPAPAGAAPTNPSAPRPTVAASSAATDGDGDGDGDGEADTDSADSSAAASSDTQSDNDDAGNWNNANDWRGFGRHRRMHQHENDLVSIGHDANLVAGGQVDSVVAVFGSASNNGTARQDVVSVFGDTTINGPTAGSAVAVLGNVTVNADVGEDVVSVLGNVTLGPAAHVHGHVVSVLGTVTEDPAAIVDEGVERVLPEDFASAAGVRHWVGHGLMLGRPLVIGSGLGWLWGLSFALLAIYTILALLFREATEHCIATLNDNPGKSLIVAILAVLLTPLMLFLLAITVVGILVIPIALVVLFIAGIFGKTTVLGWIGGRCFGLRAGHAAPHPAAAVLVGGLLVMLVYLVPVLGFVVFILLSMIGYGAVLYALLNRIRRSTSAGGAAPSGPVSGSAAPGPDPGPSTAPPFVETPAAAASAAPQGGAYTSGATAAPETPAAPLPLSTLPRPGFWVRMGALFIDALIIGVVVRLLLDWHDDGSANRIFLLGLAVYGAVMWKVKGTTIGGIVFDLRVVRLDSRPLDWPTVCVRALGCILSLCALGLGFIWIAVDSGRQAWHDKLAGTIVVRVPKGTPLV